MTINESAPDHRLILQGELWNGGRDWNYFLFSRSKTQMRTALSEAPETSTGLRTHLMLKHVMSPSSWEDLQVLREQYPEHVIELSVWEVPVGHLRGRNTIVWEVRKY